jgi:glucokinase
LEAIVTEFLGRVREKVAHASFGLAGPVVGGRAVVTNLPWVVDQGRVQKELGLSSVHLLNDLVAIAHGVPALEASDLETLNRGKRNPGGAIAVIAPGTGLGEAYLTWDDPQYRAHPSEGGHVDFAPTKPLEVELLRFLQARYKHVSYERICSGMGLPNIYAYLKESRCADEPAWLAEQLATADDVTPIIVNAALDQNRSCELCRATLRTFVSILGAEAGNLALKVLATGGVYLGGGIPPRILPVLRNGTFMEAFRHKGRLSKILAQIPVYVILNPKVALLGAARYGLDLFSD